ncbi:MAG: glycosyltransferase family 4 protein [Coriobacteriia bacterium]
MKILVVCQYYYPEPFRITDICEQLVRDGHRVTVLTGLPNYPTGTVPQEYRRGRRRREVLNGVSVLRSFELGRRRSVVGLALNYASFMFAASARALLLGGDYDVAFVYQLSPVTMALPGVVATWRARVPLFLYCCDIWPESMKSLLPDENGLVFRAVKRFSRFLYSQCDSVAVTSEPFLDYLHFEHGIPFERLTYIPQHAEDTHAMKWEATSDDDVTNFVFMGNIGVFQDIDCILDAVEKIKNVLRFKVHFVGDGSYLETAKELVHQKAIDEAVAFHGRHSVEEMPRFYAMADACLLTLKSENLTGLTMPAKLQGYMAAGVPVIGAMDGAGRATIDASKCGVCVRAGDSDALAATMRDFIEHPDNYASCGKNGRAYYEEHFTKDRFMRSLESALESLTAK